LRAARRYKVPLISYLLRFFRPATGLTIRTSSQSPLGGGMAGSSTMLIAATSALNRLTGAGYKREQLREISQNIESQIIRVPTGSQDYYPALYGGVNAIELRPDGVHRKRIAVDPAELNRRFLLAYTGVPRQSGINNWQVMKAHIDGDARLHRNFDRIAAIARAMRGALERGDWMEAGRLLRQEWEHRRRNAPGISTPLIDRLVVAARKAGAVGAKACGAGGGGCVLFLVEPGAGPKVAAVIEQHGGQVLPVRVEPRGARLKIVSQ
jgi:D-glycero-alpha-D-manno-heptose-7-phosphate kinase